MRPVQFKRVALQSAEHSAPKAPDTSLTGTDLVTSGAGQAESSAFPGGRIETFFMRIWSEDVAEGGDLPRDPGLTLAQLPGSAPYEQAED